MQPFGGFGRCQVDLWRAPKIIPDDKYQRVHNLVLEVLQKVTWTKMTPGMCKSKPQ